MENLNTLLEILTENTNVHICVTDVSGILNSDVFKISPKFRIHSGAFCDTAKRTQEGFELCMHCKSLCNRLAAVKGKTFGGMCPFGLYEVVCPVEYNSEVLCIVYVGNIVTDYGESLSKLKKASERTRADVTALEENLKKSYFSKTEEKFFSTAQIVCDYIKLLYSSNPTVSSKRHWAVETALQYANANYNHPLTLKAIADSCFLNEKYLGRIFKEQVGVAFHEYLAGTRLARAEFLLKNTDKNILETALDSGFNSASYFNRLFIKKHKITPKQYRQRLKNV